MGGAFNSSRPRKYLEGEKPVLHQKTKSHSSSQKAISFPDHFVVLEKTRLANALKIQKVFRGFLVRKSKKKLVGIRSEVDEIERMISEKEMVDLIRRDAKERLKVNEMLMTLVFRLDSVSGVDYGVRSCRKGMIMKSIALQERVDAILTEDQSLDGGKTKDQTIEMEGNDNSSGSRETVADQALAIKYPVVPPVNSAINETADETLGWQLSENPENVEIAAKRGGDDGTNADAAVSKDRKGVEEKMEMENPWASSEKSGNLIEGGEEETVEKQEEMEIEETGGIQENPKDYWEEKKRDEMERRMEENEKMMKVLFERDALQNQWISWLHQRVEQLEKERGFMLQAREEEARSRSSNSRERGRYQ